MNALEFHDVSKTYPNGVKALKNLSLQVEAGSFFGLLGPNGAGKTTALKILSSLIRQDSGKIYVHGFDLDSDSYQIKKLIGIVPQEFNFNIFDTVEDILYFQAGYYGLSKKNIREHVNFLINRLQLNSKRNQQARTLSGGMKRRLMLARGLVHNPRILILDEPSAGVDVEIRRDLWDFLKTLNKNGTTIILTTHYLEEVEYLCKKVGLIARGELVHFDYVKNILLSRPQKIVVQLEKNQKIDHIQWPDHYSLEEGSAIKIFLHQGESLNSVFEFFNQFNLKVSSIKEEVNRLEDMMLELSKSE